MAQRCVEQYEAAHGDRNPSAGIHHGRLADMHRWLNQPEQSLEHARRAAEILAGAPDYRPDLRAGTFLIKALALKRLDRMDEAYAAFDRCIELAASSAGIRRACLTDKGTALRIGGRYDDALAAYARAEGLVDPSKPDGNAAVLYESLAVTHAQLDHAEQALVYLAKARPVNETRAQPGTTYAIESETVRAEVYNQLGRGQPAMAAASAGLEELGDKDDPRRRGELLWQRARAHELLGELSAARADARAARAQLAAAGPSGAGLLGDAEEMLARLGDAG